MLSSALRRWWGPGVVFLLALILGPTRPVKIWLLIGCALWTWFVICAAHLSGRIIRQRLLLGGGAALVLVLSVLIIVKVFIQPEASGLTKEDVVGAIREAIPPPTGPVPTAPAATPQAVPSPNKPPSDAKELSLLFRGGGALVGQQAVVLPAAILTNRSRSNMTITFMLGVKVTENSGRVAWWWIVGQWNGERGVAASGEKIVNVSSESTVSGTLVFNLVSPKIADIPTWNIDLEDGASLQIQDLVTGIKVRCHPIAGYPPSRPDLPFSAFGEFPNK